MRGRIEHHGRVTRIVYCKETRSFITEDEVHPFLLRLDEHLAIASVTKLAPATLGDRPDQTHRKIAAMIKGRPLT